jgi:predicted RNA-binding protein YlqC (UPF0109 family)
MSETAPNPPVAAAPDLRWLLEQVVKMLVQRPDEVRLDLEDEDGETVFYLKVADEDLGRVIGKQGRTARSLRTLLAAAGERQNLRCDLEILEEGEE